MTYSFLSYSRNDIRIAERLHATSLDHDLQLWFDLERIPVAASWASAIGEAIDQADLLIIVASKHSMGSTMVAMEWERAIGRNIPIHAFLIERVDLPGDLLSYSKLVVHDARADPISGRSLKSFLDRVYRGGWDGPENLSDSLAQEVIPSEVRKVSRVAGLCSVVNVLVAAVAFSAVPPFSRLLGRDPVWWLFYSSVAFCLILNFIVIPLFRRRLENRSVSGPGVILFLLPAALASILVPFSALVAALGRSVIRGVQNHPLWVEFIATAYFLSGLVTLVVLGILLFRSQEDVKYLEKWLPSSGSTSTSKEKLADAGSIESFGFDTDVGRVFEEAVILYHAGEETFAKFLENLLRQSDLHQLRARMVEISALQVSSLTKNAVLIPILSPLFMKKYKLVYLGLIDFATVPVLFQSVKDDETRLARLQRIDARENYLEAAGKVLAWLEKDARSAVDIKSAYREDFFGHHPRPLGVITLFAAASLIVGWMPMVAMIASCLWGSIAAAALILIPTLFAEYIFYECYWKRSVSLDLVTLVGAYNGFVTLVISHPYQVSWARNWYDEFWSWVIVWVFSLLPAVSVSALRFSKVRNALLGGSDFGYEIWKPNCTMNFRLLVGYLLVASVAALAGYNLLQN